LNERLLEKVLDCPKLPSLPSIAMQVIELADDEHVTMARLAETIQNDQGLAGKILKTVNSAFYGLSKPCTTLAQAQIMLGLNAVKTLALGFTLVSAVKSSSEEDFDYDAYWRRGLYTGVSAKIIAEKTRTADPEEAFLGGLMQDIGMIALHAALGPSYAKFVNSVPHERLLRAELEELEITHPIVGSMLAARWRLPAPLLMCIKHHAQPSTAPPAHHAIVRCVGLGNFAATLLITEERAKPLQRYLERCEQWYALPHSEAEEMLDRIVRGAREVAKLLELPAGQFPDARNIIESANDKLVDMALRSDHEVEEATRRNAMLEQSALTDEMTGLASSRKFTDDVRAAFADEDSTAQTAFALIMCDIDNLGEINDQLGREVGDAVIRAVADRLRETFEPRRRLIARLGGDDFGILLRGSDLTEAAREAEAFRRRIDESSLDMTACDASPSDLRIRISVGVAAYDRESAIVFQRYEQLLHAADSAMRKARQDGGNRVKTFVPRRKAA